MPNLTNSVSLTVYEIPMQCKMLKTPCMYLEKFTSKNNFKVQSDGKHDCLQFSLGQLYSKANNNQDT